LQDTVVEPEPRPGENESSAEPAHAMGEDEHTADGQDANERRAVLDRRDNCIEPVASDLVRRLKRVLQDEQNEILDRLRQSRGRGRPEDALPSAADQAARYRDAAVAPMAEAAAVGSSFNGDGAARDLPARQWAQAMADEPVGG